MFKNYLIVLLWIGGITNHLFAQKMPSISEKTQGMSKKTGFFTFYWDEKEGKIWLEIDKLKQEFLYIHSLATGLGSNDIGLDRGQLGAEHLVYFQRIGNKVLLTEPNQKYRARSQSTSEVKAVKESFAESVLWGFVVEASEGDKVLVNATDFLLRDAHNVIQAIKQTNQGTYQLDASRSAIYEPRTKNFPQNTEFEATLTFTGGQDAGNYVYSVAPSVEALTLRQHHSFVELPDNQYVPRVYDARSGFYDISFFDYATPVGEPIMKQFISRHRLKKKNPQATQSEAVKPIIYYVDNGVPEPIRSALVEGASWWNQAFEAAGYSNAFQVKILPEDADPMDVRYHIIQWVHRSTRGWSYGNTVRDPRTGEIIKGHVSLGSLRIRQDYMIAEGLLAPYQEGKPVSDEMLKMSLARIRQLSAHEVGHTLGLMHNFAASYNQRASVMDYPHPQIKLDKNGKIDLSEAYAVGIGEWDKMAITFGYQDFAAGIDEGKALNEIIQNGLKKGLLYLSDRDARAIGGLHPYAHLWDNGKSPSEELANLLKIRQVALNQFSEKNLLFNRPMALLEDVLVPIYHLHRYQLEATVKLVGGMEYNYAQRADNQVITKIIPKNEQLKALEAILEGVSAQNLTLPEKIIQLIPPRPAGFEPTRELFDKRTGLAFDPIMAAEAFANFGISLLLHPQRANRLVEYQARENNLGLSEVLAKLIEKTWKSARLSGLQKEVQMSIEQVVLTNLLALNQDEGASWQTRALTNQSIQELKTWLEAEKGKTTDKSYQAHLELALKRIQNPGTPKPSMHKNIPPGAPIGMEDGCGE
ncbi:MAG: zinc-dependent metalloprotease [Microscillaceae bacterium]|jgi:hypothetical protein|nr:zinc-dependent metalloprotease [Microscillaceae bacterium]